MPRYGRLLTDAQWENIQPLLPKRPNRPQGGRPPANDRKVLEGISWILRSGARWQDLPDEFPHPSTCWRRLRDWEEQGVWLSLWRAFLSELNERQQLQWSLGTKGGKNGSAARKLNLQQSSLQYCRPDGAEFSIATDHRNQMGASWASVIP